MAKAPNPTNPVSDKSQNRRAVDNIQKNTKLIPVHWPEPCQGRHQKQGMFSKGSKQG